LEQVVFEQIDQTFGQDAEQLYWRRPAYCSYRGAEAGRRQQYDCCRDAGENDAKPDED
jgi:hypothetical protein